MKEALVSVVMPAYNAEKYIEQAIRSVQNQSYSNWELLICDDCSSDNTTHIIKKYQKKDDRIKLF
jgi:teichuronic acid biosynthesis glycosyltransferase TuaG